MIKSEEISVVVQGAIDKTETPKCLKSIRKYLPDAEVILSTWEGEDTSNLNFDKIIYNKDPGTVLMEEKNEVKAYNNMNRQLLTTKKGLDLVERKYTLKLRSDLILTGTGFIDYFDKFQSRINDYKLFNRKIVIPSLFTRESIKWYKEDDWFPTPFHFSDWWFFGLTQDIKTYFENTELVKEPDFSLYFKSIENINKKSPYGPLGFKFAPEQYFGYSCFSRNFPNIKMTDASDYTEEINQIYQICLVNNFIVLDFKQSNIYLNKYLYSRCELASGEQYIGLYKFPKYEKVYQTYCDSNYKPLSNSHIHKTEELDYALLRLYKHLYGIVNPKTSISNKIEKLLISIPFAGLSLIIKIFKNIINEVKNEHK